MVRQDAVTQRVRSDGVTFLDSNGTLSEPVQEVMQFLLKVRAEMERTVDLMRKVARLGLLTRSKSEHFANHGGHHLYIIDWKSVSTNRAISGELARDLPLQRVLHAHAVSLVQIGRLRALEMNRSEGSSQTAISQSSIGDFLDALGGELRAD